MSGKPKKQSHIFDAIRREFDTPDYGLKSFRKDVAKLKKLGLTSKKVDARSQQATRYMVNQVRKFADVLSGKAAVITVPKSEKPYYQNAGHRTKGHKVVVQTPHGEKARRAKPVNNIPSYTTKGGHGIPKTHVLVPYSELETHLKQTVMTAPPLKKGESYGFRFFGNNSYRLFSSKGALLEYFLAYQSVDEAIRKGRETDSQEIYRNFVVAKVANAKGWNAEIREAKAERAQSRAQANRERYNEWRRKRFAEMDELEKREKTQRSAQYKKSHATAERARRAQLKHDDPAAYAAQLEKNAARVKASRAKRKANK